VGSRVGYDQPGAVRDPAAANRVTSWPGRHQALREDRHHPLNAAIPGGRHGQPRRRHHADAQPCSSRGRGLSEVPARRGCAPWSSFPFLRPFAWLSHHDGPGGVEAERATKSGVASSPGTSHDDGPNRRDFRDRQEYQVWHGSAVRSVTPLSMPDPSTLRLWRWRSRSHHRTIPTRGRGGTDAIPPVRSGTAGPPGILRGRVGEYQVRPHFLYAPAGDFSLDICGQGRDIGHRRRGDHARRRVDVRHLKSHR
jgi:hypothetical protein